ncbi:MAG: hypothetical protein HY074_11700 [Deltaproteobacteria bacterium]|nr:hypothetical protein [Deltaproteobacteria bacterium]
MSTSSPLNKKLKEAFSIDGRALVAYRVALGLCVLLELLARLPDIKAHYTDAGILPRAEAWAHFPQTTALSIHFLFGGQAGQGLLFALTAAAAGLLISGYRARFAAIASWYLVISLQSRNEMVLYGGDHYLRILLFWAMFLPLGPKAKTASALLSPWTAGCRETVKRHPGSACSQPRIALLISR